MREKVKIDITAARRLHLLLTEETGGDPGIRDEGLLDSALESAYASFDTEELYPTVEEKAARLGFSLISNHAFVDGNKRIGMLVMMTYLRASGVHFCPPSGEVARVGIAVASGKMSYSELLDWILTNS